MQHGLRSSSKSCSVTVYDPVYRTQSTIVGKVLGEQVTNETRTYKLSFARLVPDGLGLGPQADVVCLTVPREVSTSNPKRSGQRYFAETKQQCAHKTSSDYGENFNDSSIPVSCASTGAKLSKTRKLAVTFQVRIARTRNYGDIRTSRSQRLRMHVWLQGAHLLCKHLFIGHSMYKYSGKAKQC